METRRKLTKGRIDKFGKLALMRLRFGPNRHIENIESAVYAMANIAVEQEEIHPRKLMRSVLGSANPPAGNATKARRERHEHAIERIGNFRLSHEGRGYLL